MHEKEMSAHIAEYKGKPTAYLDQNILDLFVKGIAIDLAEALTQSFQIVFSDETLKEIRRSGDYAENFLIVLRRLNAHHLKNYLEQPGFILTDRATITACDPFAAYDQYCENVGSYLDIMKSMEQWLYKFSGGRVGDGIDEIHAEQKAAFRDLMGHMQSGATELANDIAGIEEVLRQCSVQMEQEFRDTLDETERLMKQNIVDDKTWSGIKEFRNAVDIGPKELNNIEPPGVLQQIWERYRSIPPYADMEITIEAFFGVSKNPIYPDQPYFKHQKVTGIYNMLNTLGYFPDSKVHKERRFIASLSDTSHASMGSFCNYLYSRDEYFVKKVRAAYEFLEIPTSVQLVLLENA